MFLLFLLEFLSSFCTWHFVQEFIIVDGTVVAAPWLAPLPSPSTYPLRWLLICCCTPCFKLHLCDYGHLAARRSLPFGHLRRQLAVAGITSPSLPVSLPDLLLWALCLASLMMLQWNALDNTLTLFISVWIAVQWLPEGATWVPFPNLCHRGWGL